MPGNNATMLIRGLTAGFLSAWLWDIALIPGRDRSPGSFLLGLILDLLPGMIYGLAVSWPFTRDLAEGKRLRLVATTMCGGMAFFVAMLVVASSYAAFSWVALLLGGFTGSLIFGMIAFRLLPLSRPPWSLALYVLSGTLAAPAFFDFVSLLMKGPDTPNLHRSVYLGFMVWQGVTAATLGLCRPAPLAKATPLEEL